MIDDYRRVTQFRIVAGRSALLAIAARVAFTGQAGTADQYERRLATELEDVRVAMPSYEQRDFAPGSDLVALLRAQEDEDAA